MVEDPLSLWKIWILEMKIDLLKVCFGEKIYYTKKEKYQTPQISHLYTMLGSLDGDQLRSGAGPQWDFKRLQMLVAKMDVGRISWVIKYAIYRHNDKKGVAELNFQKA